MSGVALVPGKSQLSDSNGNPLAGGTVDVYLAGTTTRTNSWQDQALTTLNTNPIVLDASGSCSMWLDGSTLYKLVVKNAAGATQSHLGGDNISGAAGSGSLVSFIQSGASAVSRSAQDKMRDLVSVFDWFSTAQIADWRAGTASLDVTTAITTALSESTYGIWLPPGAGLITSVTVPTGKAMVGSGSKRTTLKQKAATTGTAVIVNSTSQACTVGGFQIDGNKANQTAANKGFALVSAGSPAGGTHFPGGNHRFDDIYAVNCKGRGIDLDGPGGVLSVGRLYTFQCDDEGIYINVQDSMFDEIDAGSSGLHGIHIGSSGYNNRIAKAKAWFSGQVDSATSGDGLYCEGWYNQIGVSELQDSGRHGLNLSASSNNIFSAVHVESAGRVSASAYGIVLSDSRSNIIHSQHKNRTSNAGYLACLHLVSGGTGPYYNNITIVKNDAALTDYVFDDATFDPARNLILVSNLSDDNGFKVPSNLTLLYKLSITGAGGTAQLVVDTGASSASTKWRITPNGNDSVVYGYSNVGQIHFSGSHATNAGWTTVLFGGGAANAKWRLQNTNGTNTQTIIEAGESGGTRQLGFFGSSAVSKPAVTGSRAANAALASLLTQLASLGLVTDSTTA